MIRSFGNPATEDLFHGREDSKRLRRFPPSLLRVAYRKLDMLHYAVELRDLASPPANRLEKLRGAYGGKYSIRINRQYRLVFDFRDGHAYEVEIVDYH